MTDEFDMVSVEHKVFRIEVNYKNGHNISIYSVPGADLETLHKIISNPYHKAGSVILIFPINKTKQKTEA